MPDASSIQITDTVAIPLAELRFQASRSGGPGGQHVNTSSTRVELWWDAAGSPSLTEEQRARIRSRLETRLTGDGQLRIVAGTSRSQARNRDETVERFRTLLAGALAVRRARRPTRPTRASKERRLAQKRARSARKKDRRRPPDDE
jgi:ribosome-associated protein